MDFSHEEDEDLLDSSSVENGDVLDASLLSPRNNGSLLDDYPFESDHTIENSALTLQPIPPPSITNTTDQTLSSLAPSSSQSAPPDDSLILSQVRQQARQEHRTSAQVTNTGATVSFQSPEWQTTRRPRFDDCDNFAVDNRTRTPGHHTAGFKSLEMDYNNSSRINHPQFDVEDDEESQESTQLHYIPSRHFGNNNNNNNLSSLQTGRDPLQHQQLFLHSSNSQHRRQKQQRQQQPSHHRFASPQLLTQQRPSSRFSLASPSSHNSHPSISTVTDSHYSSDSARSRRSTISCRSSTSASLMHNEVINLEGDAAIVAHNRRMYQRQLLLQGGGDTPIGREPIQVHTDMADDATYARTIEGMEIGMSPRGEPLTPISRMHSLPHDNAGPLLSWGIVAEYMSSARRQARKLGQEATVGVSRLKNKTVTVTQRVLHHYRPPLSPRSRELKDLRFLQKSHKEKVEQWKIHSSNTSDGIDQEDMFLSEENFCDFVLILTPQEVYRYWANLLDFREEHLGMMDSLDLWGRQAESQSEAASTNTTESKSSDEVNNLHPHAEEEEMDRHTDLPSDFHTPMTGLLRRRAKSSPGNKTSALNLYSASGTISSSLRTNMYNEHPNSESFAGSPLNSATKRGTRMSLFERAIQTPLTYYSSRQRVVSQDYSLTTYAISENSGTDGDTETPNNGLSMVRRRWGNHTMPLSSNNMLSPPVRSLTRGGSSVNKIMMSTATVKKTAPGTNSSSNASDAKENQENTNPNLIMCEEDIPNPVIPRGILVRTNGMLQFLSALKRGIVVRRHRPNREAIFCKLFSTDGGDTIHYHFVDPEEAMVAFKEQRVRYNRHLTHSSSPAKVRAISSEWSCLDGPSDGSPVHKFKVPDHVAAQRYREKLHREHGVAKRLFEIATKASNSGMIRAADLVAVQPAYHLDKRHPGVRKGEYGTASLRRSLSPYSTSHTFSLVTTVRQGLRKPKKNENQYSKEAEQKWSKGEGSELQYRVLDFEVATEGEFWLILRGFLHLHRDAAANRYAAKRSAGIGGGLRTTTDTSDDGLIEGGDNRLQRDAFLEPKTAGFLEKTVVRLRKLDDTYLTGAVMPGAVPPPSDYFLGFRSPGTQIWSRLRLAGLETHRIYAVDTRRVMIKIRCPEDRLTDVAEVLRLKMETKDGSFAPFREDTAHVFKPRTDLLDIPPMYHGRMASLLRSKDRQNIIDFIIGSRIRDSGAELGQRSDVGKMIQARVPLHMPRKLDSLCNDWVYYWRRERWTGGKEEKTDPEDCENSRLSIEDGFSAVQSRQDQDEDERPIPNFFFRFFVEAFNQPLDAVEDYFGEKVTFYFAWLQHCARHLFVLSFFSLIMTLCQLTTDNVDHPLRPFYAMGVMLWTFMVLINWRKRSNYLAYRWGSMDHKVQETTRPEFHGEYVIDPITNEWDIKYPSWKRWLKYMISVPITVSFTALAVVLILLVNSNRDKQMALYVEQKTNPSADPVSFELKLQNIGHKKIVADVELDRELLLDPTYWFVMAFLPAMLGLCIPILNFILMRISTMLNDFENYRYESEYRTHLIIKVFSFRFVSQFGTVYYYAFNFSGTRKEIENGIIRMGTSVMVYTTVSHWWNIFLQVYFFMFIRYIRRRLYERRLRKELKKLEIMEEDHISKNRSDAAAREIRLMNRRMLLDQAQDDLWFEVMNPPHDSFPEYVQAVVQFSFVACFSVVLPITPLLVLFNYLLSMRFDAYKLCRGRRRPLAMRTGGIGVWEHLLHIVAVVAVLTNCWLVAFTNDYFMMFFEQAGATATVFVVVAWEHTMLLIKYMMSTTISPFPKEIRDEMKRKQHIKEQERYATMRLKKTRSKRSKYRKSLSEDFNKIQEESLGYSHEDLSSPLDGSEMESLLSHPHEETITEGKPSERGDYRRHPSRTNPPSDGTFTSQPGELYEC
ncbi:calcium-activated chloride channel-domain containing protein [Nitzschia inconspicua]|uniref:Calcium-activated chloride channel-domain containing protein n=1 Tax=Nitzschia inconspicua TaxID=303405 RepID=A0A9K3PNB6_9STRA|nr:calcium-activated chloride channel-domain containing protein [Nitzschia inconspicua]